MTEEQFNEWLKTQPIEDKLVYLKYKYAHEDEWTFSNEILEVDMSADGYYVWSHDWDEGQQYVGILGCIAISDIDVPVFTKVDTPQTDCNANQCVQRVEYVGDIEKKRCRTCKHFESEFHTPISSDGTYYPYVICTAKECRYEPKQTDCVGCEDSMEVWAETKPCVFERISVCGLGGCEQTDCPWK